MADSPTGRTGVTARLFAAALLGAVAAAGPGAAHHSAAMFDQSKKVTITGVVKRFQWAQPHCWIDLAVMGDAGEELTWSFEGGAPTQMQMVGLTPDILKVGDKVAITGHPLRDGRRGAAFIQIVLPGGRVIATHRLPSAEAPAPPPS
jgi:hypothetical protein